MLNSGEEVNESKYTLPSYSFVQAFRVCVRQCRKKKEECPFVCTISTGRLSIIRQSIFWFHQFSGMNFRARFQISWVGASLFSGGTVYIHVLMRCIQN